MAQGLTNIHVCVDTERCKGCRYCSKVCPQRIIEVAGETNSKGYHYAVVRDIEKCTGCRFCALMCPEVAIKIERLSHQRSFKREIDGIVVRE